MKSLCFATILFLASLAHAAESPVTFDALPPLPEALSGHFAGVVQGIVIVAGGTSYSAPPWEGGTKYWHNKIYQMGDAEPLAWYFLDSLAVARAYGATVC